jgi:hypothetical protein
MITKREKIDISPPAEGPSSSSIEKLASERRPAMKKFSIAVVAGLLLLGAVNFSEAQPRRYDDTNRYTNKSTGG